MIRAKPQHTQIAFLTTDEVDALNAYRRNRDEARAIRIIQHFTDNPLPPPRSFNHVQPTAATRSTRATPKSTGTRTGRISANRRTRSAKPA